MSAFPLLKNEVQNVVYYLQSFAPLMEKVSLKNKYTTIR